MLPNILPDHFKLMLNSSDVTYSFAHHRVLVTGGARGIGLGIARAFHASGAAVIIADHDEASLSEAKHLFAASSTVQFERLDVTDRARCRAVAAAAGPITVLINNAGITRDKTLAKMADQDFDDVIETNLTGVFNVTKACLDHFDPRGPMRIINIASVVARFGNFGQTNYAAAKAGVVAMTRTWARELGPRGFRSNAVAPGFVRTKMTEALPEAALHQLRARVPVGRLGEPADVAAACLFLASAAADFINGAVLGVDGGLTL